MCNSPNELAHALYRGVMTTGGASMFMTRCEEHGGTTPIVVSGKSGLSGYVVAADPTATLLTAGTNNIPLGHWREPMIVQLVTAAFTDPFVRDWILSSPFAGLGAWVHEGEVHLDPMELYQDREVAMSLASARNQIAIYDLSAGADVLIRK